MEQPRPGDVHSRAGWGCRLRRVRGAAARRENEALHEVSVFGHDDPVFAAGDRPDLGVGRPVTLRQVDGVDGVVPVSQEGKSEQAGTMGIQQESHALSGRMRLTGLSRVA